MGLSYQDATAVYTSNGIRTQYGVIIPPGARIAAYVRSTGVQSGDDAFLAANLVATLAAGMARVRSGLGDYVVVLPGHVETIAVNDSTTFSSALLAGTKIVGVGRGSNMPTFNWAGGTALWTVNKADVLISGVRLSANTQQNTSQMVNVTAADFGFYNNEIVIGGGVAGLTINAVQLSAGADRADLSGNVSRHTVYTGGSVPVFDIQAAVADVRIADNECIHGAGAAVGHIRVAAVAATNLKILRNTLYNTTAASTVCINFGAAANDGICAYNNLGVLNNGTAAAQGILFGAGSLVKGFQNFCSDEPQKSGQLSPPAAAT